MSLSLSDRHDACVRLLLLFKFSRTDVDAHICGTQRSNGLSLILYWEIRRESCRTSTDLSERQGFSWWCACWESSLCRQSRCVRHRPGRDCRAHHLYESVRCRNTRTFVCVYLCLVPSSRGFQSAAVPGIGDRAVRISHGSDTGDRDWAERTTRPNSAGKQQQGKHVVHTRAI